MPRPASRRASTLASTGAPAARAVPVRRATSPGLAAGSRPTLLSPQTTRSGRASAGRARLSRSLARNRSSTGPTTPGWTNATRTVPAGDGAGRRDQKAGGAGGRAAAATTAVARVGPGSWPRRAAATARLTATSRKLSPQTPPRAATDSSAGAFHWLAPSRPQGPPSPSQDRTASPATNALGTSTRAAASRAGRVGPGPPSRALASQPSGSQSTARSMASGTMNGPTVGTRKALTARKNPDPPSQVLTAASRPSGAAMASSSSGTSPTRASHHQPGRGKARASGAPSPNAASRQPHPLIAVGSQVHGDVLDLQVLGDALGAALAADAGLLDPAEGGGRVRHHALVETDHARLQALDHPEGPLEVAGVDVGDQAELGVVGGRDRRVLVVEGGHRGHRPEDLLLEHPGVLRHPGEHGRLVEVAAAVARPGPDHGPRPLVEGVADQLRHLVDGVLVDQGADLDAVLGAAAD